jgi:hypothetical protein
MIPVATMLFVVIELEAYMFPVTIRFEVGVDVDPIPTRGT